jgi:hypothetical protein
VTISETGGGNEQSPELPERAGNKARQEQSGRIA